MTLVKFGEFLERVIANDIGIQDEERSIAKSEDLFGKLERACSPEGFGLDREFDGDFVFFLVLGRVSS